MARKPMRHAERLQIHYSKQRWQQLETLRTDAIKIMKVFERANLTTITHGSVARGDVTAKSDIDIFLPHPPSSFKIEETLERANINANRRLIIQATPHYAVKGYIEINEQKSVSFPLTRMRRVERDFYRFGGEISFAMLREGERVLGVDKRLMLIEPTDEGHVESSIVNRRGEVAKLLGVSLETVLDRIHALLRRDRIGRTGMFIKEELVADVTFEMALKRLAEMKPEVRRRLNL